MGILDRFEKGVENVVSSAFSKAFRSEVKPIEIASAVRREMDEQAATLSRDRTVAPNEFTVNLAPGDLRRVSEWGDDTLAGEMMSAATDHATSQSYSFVGPVAAHRPHPGPLRDQARRRRPRRGRAGLRPAPHP
jgi:hypothetical protein